MSWVWADREQWKFLGKSAGYRRWGLLAFWTAMRAQTEGTLLRVIGTKG